MYHWKKLIFDIKKPGQRNEYMYGRGEDTDPVNVLPITHESNPLYHASLCRLVDEGGISMLASEEIDFEVSVATTVPLEIPVETPPDNVDFSTLIDSMAAMDLAFEQGKQSR
jgi:hypothetical protein